MGLARAPITLTMLSEIGVNHNKMIVLLIKSINK